MKSARRATVRPAWARIAAIVVIQTILTTPVLDAQAPPARPDSVSALPRATYDAGWLHAFLLNRGHRAVWSTPVRAEVLDLDRFAGGLTLEGPGGGQQTASLRFRDSTGREWAFRSIDKDASRTLDPSLRESVAASVLQDQIGSLLPTGALVVARLLDAADVLHVTPQLRVMPDDPRLGEYRETFAGLLGLIEERPNETEAGGFAGALRVTGSERFLERLEEDPRNRVDAREYLKARLLDFLVGDWDRHPDQWRWAAFEEGDSVRWLPIPRDRDWAFARLDGLLIRAAGLVFPGYVGFDAKPAGIYRLSLNGRALDRRLLSELPRTAYDSVARWLERRIDDAVIAQAVDRLPPEHRARAGDALANALRSRRAHLPRLATGFHDLLAGWVDVQTTDHAESARVTRHADGSLHVRIAAGTRHVFERTFTPDHTREVRLYLQGGTDTVHVTGDGPPHITVRVIGGGGADVVRDATSGRGVHIHDDRGANTLLPAPHTRVDTTSWTDPPPSFHDPTGARPRDWGSWWVPVPALGVEPDIGVIIGVRGVRYGYGFRSLPWRTRLSVGGAVSSSGVFRAFAEYEQPISGRALWGRARLRGSALEVDRFYGYGNRTSREGDDDRYHARRRAASLEAMAEFRPRPELTVGAGPVVQLHRSVREANTLIDALQPVGYGDRAWAGFAAEARWSSVDAPLAPRHGLRLRARAEHFPAILDADVDWSSLSAEAATYLTPVGARAPTFAFRAGAEHRFGLFPYTHAAYIGGGTTVRGLATRRFAGRSAITASAEVRAPVAEFSLLLPGTLGVLGLADIGRVFVADETSRTYHASAGGGIWVSFLDRALPASLAAARSDEGWRVYLRGGFAF